MLNNRLPNMPKCFPFFEGSKSKHIYKMPTSKTSE
jgi:hypothetical protein